MEDKKYLKISLSTAICIFIIIILIIALVCLGMYTSKIKNSSEKGNDDTYQLSQNATEETSKNTVESTNLDVGEEININDSVAKKIIDKLNFDTYAKASIYKVGEFTINTIPNDLILRLGWDKINSSNKSILDDVFKEIATSEAMKESIANIFGTKVKYTDNSFEKIDVAKFYNYQGYTGTMGIITYDNNLYTSNLFQGGGGDLPFIHEELQKIVKYNDKMEVYVKTTFVDTEYVGDSISDFYYIMYKDFDFNTNNFKEQLAKTTESDFTKSYSDDEYNGQQIFLKPNQEVSKISSNLNTYVYTFELDNATGEYYLSGFNIYK